MSEVEPCRHTVIEYDERGWGTCRLCWQPASSNLMKIVPRVPCRGTIPVECKPNGGMVQR